MYKPGSQLKAVINYARNLYDTETFGKMDPYVQVVLGSREARTKERTDAGVNPTFNEELILEYQNETEVDFRVWDGESVGTDEFVGEARVSLKAVINNGGSWAGDLQLYRKGKKPAGKLNIQLFLIPADRSPAGSGLYPSTSPPPAMNPNYQPAPPAMNPNYQPGPPAMNPSYQPGPPEMNPNYQAAPPVASQAPPQYAQPVYAQALGYPQPIMAQATVVGQPQVFAAPVMAQPTVVYAQPQGIYPQVVMAQPQVMYRPPTGYVYRQF